MTQADPENLEEWLAQATDDERFNFLKERLERMQKDILELKSNMANIRENLNSFLNFFKTHKHDENGNAVLPAAFIKIQL